MNYYLAIDIGASSGRHILGHVENGKMVLEEMYRFVLEKTFLIIAALNYFIVFAISFVKYGIF